MDVEFYGDYNFENGNFCQPSKNCREMYKPRVPKVISFLIMFSNIVTSSAIHLKDVTTSLSVFFSGSLFCTVAFDVFILLF